MTKVPWLSLLFVLLLSPIAAFSFNETKCMTPVGNSYGEVYGRCYQCMMEFDPVNAGVDHSVMAQCEPIAQGWCMDSVGALMCDPDTSKSKGCAPVMTACLGRVDILGGTEPCPGNQTRDSRGACGCFTGGTLKGQDCYCWDQRTKATTASACPRPPRDPVPQPPGDDGEVARDPNNPRNPADPGGPPGGGDPGYSQAEIQQDINSCQGTGGTAHRCCVSNPMSCVSAAPMQNALPPPQQTGDPAADQAALQRYCAQMQASSSASGSANNNAGNTCFTRYKECESNCARLANKYATAAQQAPNSPNAAAYRNAAQQLSAKQETCSGYAPQVRILGQQVIHNAGTTAQSGMCSNLSQANPSSIPGAGGMPGQQAQTAQDALNKLGGDPCAADPSSAACAKCTENPDAPGCGNSAQERVGQASFGGDTKKDSSQDFNLPDLGDMQTGMANGIGGGKPGDAPTYKTIANNAGGGIPGSGGGSPASLGGSGRGSPGSPGYNTDVLGGFSGGGGGGGGMNPQSAAAAAAAAGAQGFNTGGSFGSDGRNPAGLGTDLKKYLPGGELDPNARFGGNSAISSQIHGKNVNIWGKISTRLQEKCRLGVLYDCDPVVGKARMPDSATIQKTQLMQQQMQQMGNTHKKLHEKSKSIIGNGR